MISLLAKVPITLWLAIAIGIWGGYGHLKANRLQSSWDADRLAQAEIARESEILARKAEFKAAQAAREVQDNVYARVKQTQAALSNANTVNRELRDTLAAAKADRTDITAEAICGVDGKRGEALERLLGESFELVTEGAKRVRELSDTATGLQDYIGRVCVNDNN